MEDGTMLKLKRQESRRPMGPQLTSSPNVGTEARFRWDNASLAIVDKSGYTSGNGRNMNLTPFLSPSRRQPSLIFVISSTFFALSCIYGRNVPKLVANALEEPVPGAVAGEHPKLL